MQFDAATGDCLLYRLGEVVPQVPAISHLDRAGCAAADGFGIRTGPIPADDLDPGMLAQPVGEGVCVRSASTSIGRWVSISMMTVP